MWTRLARRAQRTTRHYALLPRNMIRSRGLATSATPPIAYLGFNRRGNAGDDAIFLAHERSLPGARLAPLPLEFERATLALLGRARRRPLHAGILVGGGTVVGRPQWRERLQLGVRAQAGPVAFTGVGIEDPEFEGARQHADAGELARWAELLGGAAHLSVRGPRSAELLRDIGIEAPVVSDPALLLGPDAPTADRVRPKLLGVNVADPEDQYAGTGSRVLDAATEALRDLQRSGWSVRLLAFDRKDLELARALGRALDGRAEVVAGHADVDGLLGAIAECDVLVGQRLHGVVFAAAMGVPALAIDYRPKCRDFQLSIGRGEWTVSTLEITAGRLRDAVVELHEGRAEHARQIEAEVAAAKQKLRAGERELQRVFGSAS